MWVVISEKNVAIATINVKPSVDDLNTRNETAIQTDEDVKVGAVYKDGQFIETQQRG